LLRVYSQSTGVEIRASVKSSEEQGVVTERSGRIHLRFFKLTPKVKADEVTQIRFISEPDDGVDDQSGGKFFGAVQGKTLTSQVPGD
jgi:hypothetical protein